MTKTLNTSKFDSIWMKKYWYIIILSLKDILWVVGCYYKLREWTIAEDLFKIYMWLPYEFLLLRT